MDFSHTQFFYPAFPVQYEQMHEHRTPDYMPMQHLYSTGYYLPQPTYLPPIQPVTKPATENTQFSYNKNELRSSIFNQILQTFPELSNKTGINTPSTEPPSCLYEKPTPTRYSERQPFENNLADDIMREEFDTSTSYVPSPKQTLPLPVQHDPVTDMLEQALSSAAARVTKSKRKQEPIVCSVCQKVFSSKANLRVHFQQHQDNKRPHQCQFCGKRFTQKSTLRTHMRVHTGERPYKCEHCPKSFADLSTYTKHVRIHSGERPYVCNVCGKGFSQSGNMIRHRESHSTN